MQDMTKEEVEDLLADQGFCVVALAVGNDAYAIPLFYARDEAGFYFHSHRGLKEEFLAATKEACLVVSQVDQVDVWSSVQVIGKIERLSGAKAIQAIKGPLARVPLPPEWSLDPAASPKRGGRDFVWRLVPSRVTGRKSDV